MRTKAQIGRELVRALKRKWGNRGMIVAGGRCPVIPAKPAEIANLLLRLPAPRFRNFCRMAAEEAIKRMGSGQGANKYLGTGSTFVCEYTKKRKAKNG